jgi:hypothetical protein
MTIHLTWISVLVTVGVLAIAGVGAYVLYGVTTLWLFCRGMKGGRKRRR